MWPKGKSERTQARGGFDVLLVALSCRGPCAGTEMPPGAKDGLSDCSKKMQTLVL